ncbi:hypothetical protein EG68_06163 [Paragonimus skrjabini miyazakii]|uniref:Uncharacterized protein n=1 Tax=Paragonimus skrjabini miyazakii TaxID=59628 RepID=A0A8S9YNM3_9TREM|nr:hypothetical protein EG68_06163 [Paragonimus skrjabini miyazakii]
MTCKYKIFFDKWIVTTTDRYVQQSCRWLYRMNLTNAFARRDYQRNGFAQFSYEDFLVAAMSVLA